MVLGQAGVQLWIGPGAKMELCRIFSGDQQEHKVGQHGEGHHPDVDEKGPATVDSNFKSLRLLAARLGNYHLS